MRIDRITYETWKGLTETLSLKQVNLLLGPNGSGKTARLLGPQYAITGGTPFGAKPEAALLMGAHSGCAVGIELDSGFSWGRRLTHNTRKGTLKTRIFLRGHEGDGLRQCEPVIHEKVGNFAPMFDIGAFLGLSDDKRRDAVLRWCSAAAELTGGDDLAHEIVMEFCKLELGEGTVTEASLGHGGPVAELATKLKSRMSPDRSRALDMMIRSVRVQLQNEDVALAIGEALDSVRLDTNSFKKTSDEANQAARKLSDRKSELRTVSDSVETLQQRVCELREQKEQVVGDLGLAEGRARSVADHRAGIGECTDAIAAFNVELVAIEPPDDEAVEKTAAAYEAEAAELEKIEEPENPALGKTGEELIEAETIATAKLMDVGRQGTALQTAKVSSDAATKQLEMAEHSPWVRCLDISREIGGPVSDLVEDKAVVLMLWTELVSIIVENSDAGIVEHLRESVRNAEGDVTTARERFDAATAAHTTADTALKEARYTACGENVAFEAARTTYMNARMEAVKYRGQAKECRDTAQASHDRIEQLARQKADLHTNGRGHETRLEELLKESSGESVPSLTQRGEALATEIATIEQRIEDKQAYQQLEAELAKCQASAESELTNHDVAKCFADAIRHCRNRLMIELVAPLRTRIDWFLAAAGIKHHSYCKLENAKGNTMFELGWVVDDMRRVALPSLSGGESAIFCAALAYAIVDLANPPLRLLLLEIAEVDEGYLRQLLHALVEVGKRGMQVIAATHIDPQRRVEGVHVIECSARSAPVPVGV